MQLETKDHETGYAGVGGLRTLIQINDLSGCQIIRNPEYELTVVGNLSINNKFRGENGKTN